MSVTANELLAVMGARELRNNTTVFTGVGAPMMASVLAQRTHAPRRQHSMQSRIYSASTRSSRRNC